MRNASTKIAPRIVWGSAVAAAALLAVVQIAWACTAQPRIINLIPLSATRGQQIAISGQGVSPEVAPQDAGTSGQPSSVEIRWNSVRGPSLGTAQLDRQGSFSTRVVVPDIDPGIYTIVVAAGDSGIARAALEVIPGPNPSSSIAARTGKGASADADLWEGFRSQAAKHPQPPNPAANDSGLGLKVGMAMAAAGAIALTGSSAAIAVRRAFGRPSKGGYPRS